MRFRCPSTLHGRRAFTLVELLIVIIIIGILASALLIVAGGAEEKATVNRIISDVRTMKAAALLYNSDHGSWPIWALAGPPGSQVYRNMVPGLEAEVPSKYVGRLPVNDRYWLGVMNDETLASGDVRAAVILYDRGLSQGIRNRMGRMAVERAIYAMDDPSARDFSLVHTYSGSDSNMIWFITAGP